jgi:uncharacterized protein
MREELAKKYDTLVRFLRSQTSILIALSGGVDSVVLTYIAHSVLKEKMLAVTSVSPAVPEQDLRDTSAFVKKYSIPHRFIETQEFENENYLTNPINRCFYCKWELYHELVQLAREEGFRSIANGANYDDLGDYRPGMEAAKEFRVVSPFIEAKLTKNDIRLLAKEFGLKWWNKPASPCLASRIPYGEEITPEKLRKVEQAEQFLGSLGINVRRVRYFVNRARIEVPEDKFGVIRKNREHIIRFFQTIGFEQFELKPFKSGSLNEGIHEQKKAGTPSD